MKKYQRTINLWCSWVPNAESGERFFSICSAGRSLNRKNSEMPMHLKNPQGVQAPYGSS